MNSMLRNLLFFVCTIFVSALVTELEANQLQFSEEVIAKIMLNENHCVHSYQEGRIYLRHENIYPMEDGLFLDLNGTENIPLSGLNADSRGCWIPNVLVNRYLIPQKCSECGRGYYVKCTNPDCPLNKK